MTKKREVRCDSTKKQAYYDLRCVLRTGHVGRCLAWMYTPATLCVGTPDVAVRWTPPLPAPCGRAVAVNARNAFGDMTPFGHGTCTRPSGHDGPCEVTL